MIAGVGPRASVVALTLLPTVTPHVAPGGLIPSGAFFMRRRKDARYRLSLDRDAELYLRRLRLRLQMLTRRKCGLRTTVLRALRALDQQLDDLEREGLQR